MPFFLPPIIVFLLVVLLVMPLKKLAHIGGIVDKPDSRKKHAKEVPPIGGIIIFSVFLISGVVFGFVDLHQYWSLYVGLVILLMLGAFDDQFHVPALIKLGGQVVAAAVVIFGGNVEVAYLGDLFSLGTVWTGFLSYPATLVAVVLLINAMNLMDGLDGLVGGVSSVIFGWFMLAYISVGSVDQVHLLGILIAALAGFLVFNMRNPWRRKASLFLGDAGSMSLGLVIAWFAVHLARSPSTPLEPINVAWIIGFPIFDTCAQFYRRKCEGLDPFAPDRGHFHHHFINAGIPARFASPIIISIIAVMGGVGYLSMWLGVPSVFLSVGWIVLLFLHISLSRYPERYSKLIGKCFSRFVEV